MKQTPTEAVRQKMRKLNDQKTADLIEAETRLNDAHIASLNARRRAEEMTAAMDLSGFEAAQEDLRKAHLAEQMYQGKVNMVREKRYITEEESDAEIDSLLEYETDLGQAFEDTLRSKLTELKAILDTYKTEIKTTELTINEWCSTVYPNFRSGTALFTGPDGQRTNRATSPQPVHPVPFVGNSASQMVHEFLEKMQKYVEA